MAGRPFLEPEVAFRPAQQLEDRFFDLRLELAIQLPPGHGAEGDEDVTEPTLIAAGLHAAGAVEVRRRDLADPDEPRAERLRVAADRGRHHAASIEAHRARGLAKLRRDAQHSTLPA